MPGPRHVHHVIFYGEAPSGGRAPTPGAGDGAAAVWRRRLAHAHGNLAGWMVQCAGDGATVPFRGDVVARHGQGQTCLLPSLQL